MYPMYQTKKITTKAVFDMETGELLHWEGFDYSGPLDLCEGDPAGNDPGTQDADGAAEGNDAAGNEGNESYFLTVDDRTRYRTQEEAIEGIRNAGQRIAELTPWQQTAKEYGLTDPNEVAALLDELAELRAKEHAGESTATTKGTGATNQTGQTSQTITSASQANLDPNSPEGKQAAAIKWLQENGVNAGLVSKDQLTQLTSTLERLEAQSQTIEEERFQQRMEQGRNVLQTELRTAGLFPTDPKDAAGMKNAEALASLLEDSLATWVNANPERVKAFHAGGEKLTSLIKTGLQRLLPTLNVLRNSSGANYAEKRNASMKTVTKAAPGNKVASNRVAASPAQAKTALKAEDGLTPAVHDRAWELFESIRSNQA